MGEGNFQVATCAIIERPDGKILMMRRTTHIVSGGEWEFPGGRLGQFESFEDGLKREVGEETGLQDIAIVMPVAAFTYMRGGKTAAHEVKGTTFWCTVSGEVDPVLSDEHDAVAWLDIDEAIERAKESVAVDLRAFRSIRERLLPRD